MSRSRLSSSAQYRALYIAAIAVIIFGALGAVFVPKAHATPSQPAQISSIERRIVRVVRSDVGGVSVLLGTGCLSFIGLLSWANSQRAC